MVSCALKKKALLWRLSLALLAPVMIPVASAQAPVAQQQAEEPDLLLEVRLGAHVLSSAITAYQSGSDILLPLGELARLLTIAVSTAPETGRASGYLLNQERTFSLDAAQSSVTFDGRTGTFDPGLVRVGTDDIYVASQLLERWLPVDLEVDFSSLSLRVRPREKLPLEARLERETGAGRLQGGTEDAGAAYPRHQVPYRLAGIPVIDQTLGINVGKEDDGMQASAAYTAYLTGDLLGMETSLFLTSSSQTSSPDVRFTMGRHDPDAGLLGPLHARSFQFGSITVPGVANIARTSPSGEGVTVSSRPLTQPTTFDRHSLQGELPPGWDVELYFNNALIAFQQSRPDGKYSFEGLPLVYGPNEFRLVFHGPLGQMRVERQTFLLEQSATAPGEFYYSVTEHRDEAGQARTVAQFDLGLNRSLSMTGGLVRMPVAGEEQRYLNVGVRGFLRSFLVSGEFIRSDNGGSLAELGIKTRIGAMSIGISRAYADGFSSDLFVAGVDPVRLRDNLRLDGSLPLGSSLRLPLTVQATRDRLQSGQSNLDVSARISTIRQGISLSNALRWQSLADAATTLDGSFQISRRVAGIGLSSQIGYTLRPDARLANVALSADKTLAGGYIMNLGISRSIADATTQYLFGVNKSLGRFGLGVNTSYSSEGDFAVGLQLFVSSAYVPRQSAWMFNAQSKATSGAASVRVFVDKNMNGTMDAGDEPIPNVRFTVSGGTHPGRTDAAGTALLDGLPVKQNVDVVVDIGSLEDPQWSPVKKGVRLTPRPGVVAQVDFPVILTGEIDGTVYLVEDNAKRGVGDVQLELIDAQRNVVARAVTASDGYYIVPAVPPGDYLLRVSPEQLQRLNLTDTGMHMITMPADGEFINGIDFLLTRP
jgi:hypothetical protein